MIKGTITATVDNGDDDMEGVNNVFRDMLTRLRPQVIGELLEAMTDQYEDASETDWAQACEFGTEADKNAYLHIMDEFIEAVFDEMAARDGQ